MLLHPRHKIAFVMLTASLIVGCSFPIQSNAQRVEAAAQTTDGLDCKYLDVIAQGMLHQHILYETYTPELEKRTVDQIIKHLDPFKIYLTAGDIESMKKDFTGLFEQIQKADCSSLKKAQSVYLKRMEDRLAFVKKQLGKDFKFDKKTALQLDPDKRQIPKDEAEAQEFHKKYLQFQISNYLATGEKLDQAKDHVLKNYDRTLKRTKDYKSNDLLADYLDAFAHSLDPHSSFFSKEVLEDFEIQMRLQLEGIGATLSSQDGFTTVEQLVPGGSASKSGLVQTGDKIIAVSQSKGGNWQPMENVVEMDLRDVVRKIRGPKGTQVKLRILRKEAEENKTLEVVLNRDKINLEDDAASISYVEKDSNGVKRKLAVLDLPSFYADTRRGGRSAGGDLKRLIKEAKEKKVDGIVLDLSTNGGGSLEDAVKVAGLFFKTGNVVKQSSKLSQKGSGGTAALADSDSEVDWAGPLVILTSRISASASEIVAGTLKDYGRALIVGGDHTFGKGTVQQVLNLPQDLGAIKVTIGMFFTAGGKSTQHTGVEGDILLPSAMNTTELGEKNLDYSLAPQKIEPFLSKEAYVKSGTGAWKQLDKSFVGTLQQRSTDRVAVDADFKKILEEIKKSEKDKNKLTLLEDTLKDKKEFEQKKVEKKNQSKEAKKEEYLKRADVKESLNILLDYVDLDKKVKLKPIELSKATAKVDLSKGAEEKASKEATGAKEGK